MHWEINRVTGRREVGSQLDVEMRGECGPEDKRSYNVLGVVGYVYVHGVRFNSEFTPISETLTGGILKCIVTLSLLPDHIEMIERKRAGGDLDLSVTMNTLLVRSNSVHSEIRLEDIYWDQKGAERIKLSQRDWLKCLKEMGYGDYFVIEIPVPEIPKKPEAQAIAKRLEKAREMLWKHENKEVVAELRLALEDLRALILDSNGKLKPNIVSKIDANSPGQKGYPKKSKRLENMENHLRVFLHIAHHTGYEVTRDDAELAMMATVPLARYLLRCL